MSIMHLVMQISMCRLKINQFSCAKLVNLENAKTKINKIKQHKARNNIKESMHVGATQPLEEGFAF